MCFKRKKHIPITKSFQGEVVLTKQQQSERIREIFKPEREFYNAVMKMIEQIQESQIEIDETELSKRLKELADVYGIPWQETDVYGIPWQEIRIENQKEKMIFVSCPNCGAPMHNGKCEYCGTECKQ